MIKTNRISSGFDVELQLGGRWFFTAITLLNDNGLLAPPGIPIIIREVEIIFEPDWDLAIDILGLEEPVLARAELNEQADELVLTTNFPGIPPTNVPFEALDNLAGLPVLVKLQGNNQHEPVLALLANLNLQAVGQKVDPLPEGEFLERGDPDKARSFLPKGQDIAFGVGKQTFSRFANHIWHTELRAPDGSHPMPDAENKRGEWSKVTMTSEDGRIRLDLEGDVPVDSPIIDVIPDPHVTITLLLTPRLNGGKLSFEIKVKTDVDMGLLGNLFGGVMGLVIAFIIGLLTGGLGFVILGAGFLAGVIVIEIVEVIIEGIVKREVQALIDGQPVAGLRSCHRNIVQIPTQDAGGGLGLGLLDVIPASIPIFSHHPDTDTPGEQDILFTRTLLVSSLYEEVVVNSNGLAASGFSGFQESFQAEPASLVSSTYEDDRLVSLLYQRLDGRRQRLPIEEIHARAAESEIQAPFKVVEPPPGASLRPPLGRLACVCLNPVSIRREKTIVKEIEFERGLRLLVQDAVRLQNAGVIVLPHHQLIHPQDYNPYFRSRPDEHLDNNLESLPKIEAVP